MRNGVILFVVIAGFIVAGCGGVTQTVSDAVNGALGHESTPVPDQGTMRSVGESDPLNSEQAVLKQQIDGFYELINGPSLSTTRQSTLAYHATVPKFNTHGLITGARAILICRSYLAGTYAEIIVYDHDWIDEAEAHYEKVSVAENTAYAVNGDFVLWFPETGDASANVVEKFRTYRF